MVQADAGDPRGVRVAVATVQIVSVGPGPKIESVHLKSAKDKSGDLENGYNWF